MIDIKTIGVWGFEGAIHGMRMPYESFDKSDSEWDSHCSLAAGYQNCEACPWEHMNCELAYYRIGKDDMTLCKKLIKAGSEHRKFLRMIHVQFDIRMPRYFATELDTYKIGTTKNSSSTMHLITKKELTIDDFSCNEVTKEALDGECSVLNGLICVYNKCKDIPEEEETAKLTFEAIKQLLPESFMQMATYDMDYETLLSIYHQRKNHRLSEWHTFCDWCMSLPYFSEFVEAMNDK